MCFVTYKTVDKRDLIKSLMKITSNKTVCDGAYVLEEKVR